MSFKNPTPVAILLQKVTNFDTGDTGVVIGRRNIEPQSGQWALIGGHMESTDKSIEDAASREYFEETGLRPFFNKTKLIDDYCDGNVLLLFIVTDYAIPLTDLSRFKPNRECSEIRASWRPESLCWPSHTAALFKFFRD